MATEIRMPLVSPSITEGALARWLKKEGEAVKAGEVIAELETDKALVDLEAEADGILAKVLVADGTTGIKVGSVLAVVAQAGEALPTLSRAETEELSSVANLPAAIASLLVGEPHQGSGGTRVMASPVARRLARHHKLDLGQIRGSGPAGRVVKRDVELAVATAGALRPALSPAPAPIAPSSASVPGVAFASGQDYDETPHSGMRRVIAQRLTQAKQEVPHFYLTIDCRVDELVNLRQQVNTSVPEGKISLNDMVVRAAAIAMRKVPAINASWTEAAVRRNRRVDIAVAVATASGLLTPVVRDADTKSLGELSSTMKDLGARARDGKLLPHEYQGGGLTISNLGMYGIREFSAIINPPQACILAVGAVETRPTVIDGSVSAATMMTCTLSVDHRVVDGVLGAQFLSAFKALVERPLSLLV